MRTIITSVAGLVLGSAIDAPLGSGGDAVSPLLGPGHALLSAASLAPQTNVGMAVPTRRAAVCSNAAAYALFGLAIGFGYPTRRRNVFGRVVLAIAAGTVTGTAVLTALLTLLAVGPDVVCFMLALGRPSSPPPRPSASASSAARPRRQADRRTAHTRPQNPLSLPITTRELREWPPGRQGVCACLS